MLDNPWAAGFFGIVFQSFEVWIPNTILNDENMFIYKK